MHLRAAKRFIHGIRCGYARVQSSGRSHRHSGAVFQSILTVAVKPPMLPTWGSHQICRTHEWLRLIFSETTEVAVTAPIANGNHPRPRWLPHERTRNRIMFGWSRPAFPLLHDRDFSGLYTVCEKTGRLRSGQRSAVGDGRDDRSGTKAARSSSSLTLSKLLRHL